MTNTLNTPVEALEHAYPLRVRRYCLRTGSGGKGRNRGGDGVVKEFELLGDARISLISERRLVPPFGLQGGGPGKTGRNLLVRGGRQRKLPGKCTVEGSPGDRLVIETPGGGGWGDPS